MFVSDRRWPQIGWPARGPRYQHVALHIAKAALAILYDVLVLVVVGVFVVLPTSTRQRFHLDLR